jgi:hypothetical protein
LVISCSDWLGCPLLHAPTSHRSNWPTSEYPASSPFSVERIARKFAAYVIIFVAPIRIEAHPQKAAFDVICCLRRNSLK